ncbi:MAG: TRAP transporter small permease [Thermodesulfobacteriota bacterium]
MELFLRWFDRVVNFLAVVASLLLILIVLIITYQVVGRYFFNISQVWVNCLVEFSLLWLTFFGAAFVLRQEKHIEVDLLVSHLRPRPAVWSKIVTSLAGGCVCVILTYYSGLVVWENYHRGITVMKAMETPKFLVLMPIMIGSLLLAIQFLIRTMNLIKGRSRGNRPEALSDI